MKFSLIVKERAKLNLTDVFLSYENSQKGLGERFLKVWEKGLKGIEKHPFLYQKKHKDFRTLLLKPFPYHIIYEIDGNEIVVYNVIHSSRNTAKRFSKK